MAEHIHDYDCRICYETCRDNNCVESQILKCHVNHDTNAPIEGHGLGDGGAAAPPDPVPADAAEQVRRLQRKIDRLENKASDLVNKIAALWLYVQINVDPDSEKPPQSHSLSDCVKHIAAGMEKVLNELRAAKKGDA